MTLHGATAQKAAIWYVNSSLREVCVTFKLLFHFLSTDDRPDILSRLTFLPEQQNSSHVIL
jgi:hypothetical protein